MTGIVNSTGARSGVIGTTVGAVGSVSGTGAFMAQNTGNSWQALSDTAIVAFNSDSADDCFDDDNCYNTSTYKYTAPGTGVYLFWYAIFTANTDADNEFGFTTNNGEIQGASAATNKLTYASESGVYIQNGTQVVKLTEGDTLWIASRATSDFNEEQSCWGGCRLS